MVPTSRLLPLLIPAYAALPLAGLYPSGIVHQWGQMHGDILIAWFSGPVGDTRCNHAAVAVAYQHNFVQVLIFGDRQNILDVSFKMV